MRERKQSSLLVYTFKSALAGLQRGAVGAAMYSGWHHCCQHLPCRCPPQRGLALSSRDREIRRPSGNMQKPNHWTQGSFKQVNQKHQESYVSKTLSLMFPQGCRNSQPWNHCLWCLACSLPQPGIRKCSQEVRAKYPSSITPTELCTDGSALH